MIHISVQIGTIGGRPGRDYHPAMMPELVVGLDLGGTFTKALLLDSSGAIKAREELESGAAAGPDHTVEVLVAAARKVCAGAGVGLKDVLGIGLGSPGPLCSDSGTVLSAANLPGWDHVPLRDLVSARSARPVVLLNDASAACYAEYWRGAGRGAGSVALLTLGTGVGGGFVAGGELFVGQFDNATEFGHMIVHPGGHACRCGQRGCLETYAGGSYMVERAAQEGVFGSGRPQDMTEVVACAQEGQAAALSIWQQCCDALAITCVNLQHALNPQLILLGGGIAQAGAVLLQPVRSAHRRLVWRLADDSPTIELAALGSAAGAMGAAGWFLHTYERASQAP